MALADDASVQRFLSEAPAGWARLKAGLGRGVCYQLAHRFGRLDLNNEMQNPERSTQSIRLMGLEYSWVEHRANGHRGARVANESYGFELFGEAADKPWELNSLALDPFKQARAVGETVSNCSAFESITIEGHWLDDLIHSNGFVLNSVEPEGGSLYRVTFVSKFIPYERNIILGGTLWLDASRMWVQTKYELILQSCGDMCAVHGELQYQQIGEYPFPSRLVKTYSGEGERPNQYVLDWTDVSTAVQAGDFRLTAFGLPEPDLRHPARDRASSLDFSARGGPRQFELTASNRGSRAITLMGFERCGPRGCWTVSPLPIALPPGAAATLRCRFNGRNDGDDAPVLTFYGDDHTGRMKTFMVTPP